MASDTEWLLEENCTENYWVTQKRSTWKSWITSILFLTLAPNFRHINLCLCMTCPQSLKSLPWKMCILLMFKNMLLHTMGTVAPDVFGNSDALRGIAHRTMRPQTIHKQFLMSGQRFQLNSGRFQGKSVSELLKTLSASVSASSKSTFSTTQKHFFQWNRPEWDWNRCPDTRNHLWIICIHIVVWAIPRSASELPKSDTLPSTTNSKYVNHTSAPLFTVQWFFKCNKTLERRLASKYWHQDLVNSYFYQCVHILLWED